MRLGIELWLSSRADKKVIRRKKEREKKNKLSQLFNLKSTKTQLKS